MPHSYYGRWENDDDRKKQNEDEEVVVAYSFGENDHISRLNDDNLIDIFKMLPRRDLYQLDKTSRKMHAMVNSPRLAHIKWESCHVFIAQTETSHGFYLQNRDKGEHFGYRAGRSRWQDKRFVVNSPSETLFYHRRFHNLHVPARLFKALQQLLDRHSNSVLSLADVTFDSKCLERLSKTLIGQTIKDIDLRDVHCSSFSIYDWKSLARLVVDTKARKLQVGHKVVDICIYNDEFIRAIVPNLEVFESQDRFSFTPRPKFRIPRETLFMLKDMKRFVANQIIVDGLWLTEFIMMYLDNVKEDPESFESEFHFSIDQILSVALLSTNITSEFELISNPANAYREIAKYYIVKKTNQLCAEICTPLEIRFAHRNKLHYYSKYQLKSM